MSHWVASTAALVVLLLGLSLVTNYSAPSRLVDESFDPGAGADGVVRTLAAQPDGKILVGGYITNFNQLVAPGIVRLLADGQVDSGFNSGAGGEGVSTPECPWCPVGVRAIALQPDGRILIGGEFTRVQGERHLRMARLEPNGNVDPTFSPMFEHYLNEIWPKAATQ